MVSKWSKCILIAAASTVLCLTTAGISQAEAPAMPQAPQGGAPGDPSSGQSGGQPGQFFGQPTGSDYPAPEVETIPGAYARAATARAETDYLMTQLHATVDRLRDDFANSADMMAAMREENTAYLAYDDSRRKVLEQLSGDPTYRAMISLVVSLKHKLEDERPGPKATDEEVEHMLATATLKLGYATSVSAMEAAALAADGDVQKAKARLILAGEKTGELRNSFERQIRRDPEFLAARREYDEARIARVTAGAFLQGAVDARGIALDYAYYLHRFDQYSYSPAAFAPNPYPYGYGYRRY